MEKSILQLWEPGKPLHGSRDAYPWLLPKCLRHDTGAEKTLGLTQADDEASVLLIQDLGPISGIYTCLEAWASAPYTHELVSQVAATGKNLGTSLAHLHSAETVAALNSSPEIFETLSQSLTETLVWKVMVDPLPKYLQHLPDAEELCRRVTLDIKTPSPALSNVLCHGDFHNGNVVLPARVPQPGEVVAPIVVDWEFAHLRGRGVNGDAAEFTAGIHVHLIKARTENEPLAELLRALLQGFCAGYRHTAALRCGEGAEDGDVNLELMRSAFIFHGTEMISCAYEYQKESKAFEEVFAVGLWYLRMAGRDGDEFKNMVQSEGLNKLVEEEDEGAITSLFSRV